MGKHPAFVCSQVAWQNAKTLSPVELGSARRRAHPEVLVAFLSRWHVHCTCTLVCLFHQEGISFVQAIVNCEAMNHLIVASRDSILALNEASRRVKDPARRNRLHEQAVCHSLMVLNLEVHINDIGGTPSLRSSFGARARASWRRFRRMFGDEQVRQTVIACLNAELRTEAAYAAALSLPLSPTIRRDLEHQSDEVSSYREYLKGLSSTALATC
jgi:uncharacterized protein (TIGR02284 family)